MKKTIFIITSISIAMSFTSCKKKGCTDPTATNYNVAATKDDGSCEFPTAQEITAPTYTPVFTGTYGALVAIKTIATTSTPIGTVDTSIGVAVAAFSENGGSAFVSAGTVNVDGKALNVNENNTYTYVPSASTPMGIEYSGTVNWTADGSAWPAFNASTSQGFSTVAAITSANPNTSSSYTIKTTAISGADSTLFMIAGSNGSVVKVVNGSVSEYTFSASEVSSCGAGSGIVEIVGLKYDLKNIGSKDYYLINETVRAKTVTIE